jgi:hypothetical protein
LGGDGGFEGGLTLEVDWDFTLVSNEFSSTITGGVASSWLGTNHLGELGSLAVNEDWENTVYEYVRQHDTQTRVAWFQSQTIPTPTGDVSAQIAAGVNTVNPNASDEYLMFTWATSPISNATYKKVFFAKGMNAGNGTFNWSSGGSGSSGDPRWLVYWDTDTPSNVTDVWPEQLPLSEQARVRRMNISANITDINFVGLSFGSNGYGYHSGGGQRFFYWRCYAKDITLNPCTGFESGTYKDMTWFQCRLDTGWNTTGSAPAGSSTDVNFVSNSGTCDGMYVVSCETNDLAGDLTIVGRFSTLTNVVIEDNDYWNSVFTDGNGNLSANGNYRGGEQFIDIKSGDSDATNYTIVHGNRCLNHRVTDQSPPGDTWTHSGGGGGEALTTSIDTEVKAYFDFSYNVIDDGTVSAWTAFNGSELAGTGNASFNYNLINNIRANITSIAGAVQPKLDVFRMGMDASEMYFNTFSDCASSSFGANFAGKVSASRLNDCDIKGNAFMEFPANSVWRDGSNNTRVGTGTEIGYNGWIGADEYEYGLSGTNYYVASAATVKSTMGDFIYRKRKCSVPTGATEANGGLGRISQVVPTSSTPSGYKTTVTVTIGGRTGIGATNEVFYTP